MENKRCGTCVYWAFETKRNCGTDQNPFFYASCLYEVDTRYLPHSFSEEEMNEWQGISCPCYVKKGE